MRILALVLGLVTVVLVTTVTAVVIKTRSEVSREASRQLRMAAETARLALRFRGDQLTSAVEVLTADFGFKEAVAAGDTPTLLSAMANHRARIGADALIVLDPAGKLVTSTVPDLSAGTLQDLHDLVAGDPDGQLLRLYRLIDGRPYQLVLAPVSAPVPIAWAAMGFALDDTVAREMAKLLGTEVSFVAHDSRGSFVASSLPSALRASVAAAAGRTAAAPFSLRAGTDEYLTWSQPIRTANGSLNLVLQRSLTAALRPFSQLRDYMAAIGLAILAAACVLATLLSRSTTRPVEELTHAAERLEAGDYAEDVPSAGTTELSRLASAFNAMRLAISERERTIRHQAMHDRLTGLPTRSRLTEILQRVLEEARPQGHSVTIFLIEIHQLRDVVGSFGHAAADEVVSELARRLAEAARVPERVARVATDQFAMVAETVGAREAGQRAARIAARLRAPFTFGAASLQLEARIGVSVFPEDATQADELLQRSELALYRAKESGATVGTFVHGDDEARRHRLSLLGELRRAIAADELQLDYQPKVATGSGKVLGCEALLRWRHPVRGLIPPAEFIPYAERAGLITAVTAWVLRTALRQMRTWEASGISIDVAVNVSPADLADPAFADTLTRLLAESGANATRLVVEITESAAMQDVARVVRVMDELRLLGVRFSIDDFGTGYSSLAHLKRLPVSEIKIDRSFVLDLRPHQDENVIVRSTIELGHALNLKVTAEGIETFEGWQALNELGCDLVQGYFIARPMPAAQFTAWISDKLPESVPAQDLPQALYA